MSKKKAGIVLFLIVFLLFPGVVSAQSQKIEEQVLMHLEYGFKDNAKSGSCFPLKVMMQNQGEDFKGSLEITIPVQGDYHDISENLWLGNSEWATMNNRVYCYKREVSLPAGEEKTEIFYLELPQFEADLHVVLNGENGVAASQELTLNFSENNLRILIGVLSSDSVGAEKLDGIMVEPRSTYGMEAFVKTILLETEDIYPNPEALCQLDVLILDKGTVFSPEQQAALLRWEKNGGFLLERDQEDLDVLFEHFLNGEQREDFEKHLENMSSYSFGDDEGVSEVPVRQRPSMGKYMVILCIYVVIAGPGLYLFLRRKNKLKYLWSGVCLASVIFLLIIWMLGKETNLSAPVISSCGLYEQQGNVWDETQHIGIQAPFNNSYYLYLDNSYRLMPTHQGSESLRKYSPDTVETVTIEMQEESNKILMEQMSAFTQIGFSLNKSHVMKDEETIKINLEGNGKSIWGDWENPTGYQINNAILVMKNRAAILGTLPSQESGTVRGEILYSCGNGGTEILMNEKMDFSEYEFPEYEINNMVGEIWKKLRYSDDSEAWLIGIVDNPDLSFQLNSGYQIYGTTLFASPVTINWNQDGTLWIPNLEARGVSVSGEFSSDTNLMYGNAAVVEYSLSELENVKSLTLFDAEYDEQKYYFVFRGNVAFYCWETQSFEEIENWDMTLSGKDITRYLSSDHTIRVQYLLDDSLKNIADRSCMLPCICAEGKAKEYASDQ